MAHVSKISLPEKSPAQTLVGRQLCELAQQAGVDAEKGVCPFTTIEAIHAFYRVVFGAQVHHGAAGRWLKQVPAFGHFKNLTVDVQGQCIHRSEAKPLTGLLVLKVKDEVEVFVKFQLPQAETMQLLGWSFNQAAIEWLEPSV